MRTLKVIDIVIISIVGIKHSQNVLPRAADGILRVFGQLGVVGRVLPAPRPPSPTSLAPSLSSFRSLSPPRARYLSFSRLLSFSSLLREGGREEAEEEEEEEEDLFQRAHAPLLQTHIARCSRCYV